MRAADDPDATLLEFLESTCRVAADLAGWDRERLEGPLYPPERPSQVWVGVHPATHLAQQRRAKGLGCLPVEFGGAIIGQGDRSARLARDALMGLG